MEHDHGHFEHLLHAVDTVDAATIMSIVWFSFVMSWHCAAMCGPIVCARMAQVSVSGRAPARDLLLYNLGRVISYVLLGAIVATVSDTVSEWIPSAGQALSLALAVVIAWQGIMLLFDREVAVAPRWVARLSGRITALSSRLKNGRSMLAFGFMTALLPCMTLASALAAAAMTAESFTGALVMLGFVAGTLPVMTVFPLLADNLAGTVGKSFPLSVLRRLAGVLLLVVSIITGLRILH